MITKTTVISRVDASRIAWSGLKKFHHVPTVLRSLIELHDIPKSQQSNAKKQALQIRYCLQQAREYKDAASVTSLATRPLLLYYSIMSLALAEILFKSDGRSSLDAARGEHAHHGLSLNVGQCDPESGLAASASTLVAKPMISAGKRKGTFELWHRVAREGPIVGPERTHYAHNMVSSTGVLLGSENKRLGFIRESGLSFFDCLTCSPGMLEHLSGGPLQSRIARGRVRRDYNFQDHSIVDEITIHPTPTNVLMGVIDSIYFEPRMFERLEVIESNNGVYFRVNYDNKGSGMYSLPQACSWAKEEIRFIPTDIPLNEFGILYIGLYILGNYVRYWPDKWMLDVDSGSPLAVAAEEFIGISETRMALLLLSELSSVYHVISD